MFRRFLLWALVFLLVAAVLYLSWIPDPRMRDVRLLPRGLARWADRFDTLRTAVPFVLLGGVLGWRIIRSGRANAGTAETRTSQGDPPCPVAPPMANSPGLQSGAIGASMDSRPSVPADGWPFPWRAIGWALGAMAALVLVAEGEQLLVAGRSCDWRDVAWGVVGAVAGLVMGGTLGKVEIGKAES